MRNSIRGIVLSAALLGCGLATQAQTEKVLHSFTGSPDGASPNGYLVVGNKGHLYGTTESGGTSNKGTVFELIQ